MSADIDPTGPASYFVRTGPETFVPTLLTEGAWSTSEQHISPMNGLIVHAVERYVAARGADELAITRISIDILGVIALVECTVEVEVVRPGRTIELLEVVVRSAGRAAVRARVWRAIASDTSSVAGGAGEPFPHPDSCPRGDLTALWDGHYIETLDVRTVAEREPGRARVWLAAPAPLVADEPVSDLARFVGLVDTANGIAPRQQPTDWLFPNLDLTIHLFRQPTGPWLGLDTDVVFGAGGHGLTSSTLYDLAGPVGRAEQILTVRPAPTR